jgi:colanic acid/amylovoran biosynthesis glycosyltransferase
VSKHLPAESRTGRPVAAHIRSLYFTISENWISTQVRHTPRYDPVILALHTENLGDDPPPLYAVCERPRVEQWANRAVRKLITGYFPSHLRVLRRTGASLIHAHFGPEGCDAIKLAEAAGIPLITTFYGYDANLPWRSPEWKSRYRELFARGALFLAEGPALARRVEQLGCPPEKIRVQRLGVEIEKYPSVSRTLGRGEPLRILVAGRVVEKKGMPDAIRAIGHAARQGANVRVTIFGDSDRTESSMRQKQEVLRAIDEFGLSDRVTMMGMRPLEELRRAYYDHHVFLSPSVLSADGDSEGGAPVTIIEAAATGMTVVATRHDDIPNVITHGRSGLLADEHDVPQLAAFLLKLAAEPGHLQSLGHAAAGDMRERFDADKQGLELAEKYDEVRARHSSATLRTTTSLSGSESK